MSAHILLIILNDLGKVIKCECEACRAFYRFCQELNKFNKTRA